MFKSVLADDRLKEAEFICRNGPIVIVPIKELRRVLPLGSDHYFGAQIWGPFNIDIRSKTIGGHPVAMDIQNIVAT
jgi:hypothetical protein